eukprot:5867079-Prymnesium_polylepis.1
MGRGLAGECIWPRRQRDANRHWTLRATRARRRCCYLMWQASVGFKTGEHPDRACCARVRPSFVAARAPSAVQ